MEIPVLGALIKGAAKIENIPIELKQKHTNPIRAQKRELRKLLRRAKNTEFGRHYGFAQILEADDIVEAFRERVPVFDYNKMYDQWWHKNLQGQRRVTWRGKVKYFALSSGTSEAASKYIPVTRGINNRITRAGIRQLASLARYDIPANFYTKGCLMIGGSTDLQRNDQFGWYAGDLSGISAGKIPAWFDFFYKPGQEISRIHDWGEKMDRMVKEAPKWDIGVIVGVPAWVQILIERIIEEYHLETIHDLWPNLRIYVHSGVAFAPYEKAFDRLFGKKVIYIESYLASEGYIAYQVDFHRRVMQMLVDNGIYFEFIPFNEENFDDEGSVIDHPKTLSLSEVEPGVDYALLLSTCAGAWRYLIGDTIRFLDVKRCEIVITGRTKQFLSMVGEHLSQDNMNRAVELTCEEMGITVPEFTVAGVRNGERFAHHWYLGTDQEIDKELAIKKIDTHLCELNDDYAVERQHALNQLYIDTLPVEHFYTFMRDRLKKWGGATKFPRVLKGKRLEMWQEFLKEIQ